jgi:hypothetical protein
LGFVIWDCLRTEISSIWVKPDYYIKILSTNQYRMILHSNSNFEKHPVMSYFLRNSFLLPYLYITNVLGIISGDGA